MWPHDSAAQDKVAAAALVAESDAATRHLFVSDLRNLLLASQPCCCPACVRPPQLDHIPPPPRDKLFLLFIHQQQRFWIQQLRYQLAQLSRPSSVVRSRLHYPDQYTLTAVASLSVSSCLRCSRSDLALFLSQVDVSNPAPH